RRRARAKWNPPAEYSPQLRALRVRGPRPPWHRCLLRVPPSPVRAFDGRWCVPPEPPDRWFPQLPARSARRRPSRLNGERDRPPSGHWPAGHRRPGLELPALAVARVARPLATLEARPEPGPVVLAKI